MSIRRTFSALAAAFVVLASTAACIDETGLADAKCTTVCGGVCVDVRRDSANCGACGAACGPTSRCEDGVCRDLCADGGICRGDAGVDASADAGEPTCPTTYPDRCGTDCTDLRSDRRNCGGCGVVCAPSTACVDAACRPLQPAALQLSILAGSLGSFGNLDGAALSARFHGPHATCVVDGSTYVFESTGCVIRRVDAAGLVTTVAGSSGACGFADGVGASARVSSPQACVTAADGIVYFADTGACAVRRLDTKTLAITTVAGAATCGNGGLNGAQFNSPQGIALDPGGALLYVADTANNAIRTITLATGAVALYTGAVGGQAGADDATGLAARFREPTGLYVDATDKALYVADTSNHTLRRVSLDNRAVTTVVGNPGAADHLDGVGRAARLAGPYGLAGDGAGQLYIAENRNHTVRSVKLADFATTTVTGAPKVAGYADGRGATAQFANPRGIAFDGADTLVVADFGNHALRQIRIQTAATTTRAGLGAAAGAVDGPGTNATFGAPSSIAFDGRTTLFTTDSASAVVRSIDLATGAVTTIAGAANVRDHIDETGAAARFSEPAALVHDGASTLYVADRGSHTIRRVALTTRAVTTVAGAPNTAGYAEGAAPLFNAPTALALGAGPFAGKLFVADASRVVRELDAATGFTSLVAGRATEPARVLDGTGDAARFSQVSGLAFREGKLYVGDADQIRVIDLATKVVTTLSGVEGYSDGAGAFARFDFTLPTPSSSQGQLSFDADGRLLVADFHNGVLRRFDPTTRQASTLAGIRGLFGARPGPLPTSLPTSPRAIVAVPGGYAFAANNGVFLLR